jgi:AP-1 complex subunit gamma-1
MVGDCVNRVVSLLNNCTHGMLITVMQLMTRILIMDREHNNAEAAALGAAAIGGEGAADSPCWTAFLHLELLLVRLLRNLLSMGYSLNHIWGGSSTCSCR